MSNLPGNPHAENVELVLLQTVLSSDDSGTQTIESLLMDNANATLALAYEQRTANLIAYVEKIDDQTLVRELCAEIAHRLGLQTSSEMRAEK